MGKEINSRMINGSVPIMIDTTFDSSHNPKTINKIGSNAKGGIIDSTVTNCESRLRTSGSSPIKSPNNKPNVADIPMPNPKRLRLAHVSC